MTREKALGLLLGFSAGVLVDSFLVVILSPLIIFISPLLLVPPVGGILLGLRWARSGRLPAWSWFAIIPSGPVLLLSAALVPYLLAVAELRWQGTQIPAPPDSSMIQVRTGPLGSSMAGPSVTHVFETGADEETVLFFYQEELGQSGWQLVSDRENFAWYVRSGRHMFVRLAGEQGRTTVAVTHHQDRVLGPWLVLFAILTCAIYVRRKRRRSRR